jgi:hypothetical protein
MPDRTLRSLSPARREFVRLIQHVEFGQLHDLHIRRREPITDPPPRIVRTIRLGATGGAGIPSPSADFAVKRQFLELFRYFDRLGTGKIARIDVQGGVPCLVMVEETLSTNGHLPSWNQSPRDSSQ